MDFEKSIELIGHSVHSPRFKEVLKELDIHEVPEAKLIGYILDIIPDMDIPRIYNEEKGIEIGYMAQRGWDKEDLKSSFTDNEFELIVRKIGFWKMFKDVVYPYSLRLGDEYKTVSKKINQKPQQKSKAYENGFNCYYYKDNLEIIAYFNKDKRLQSFLLALQDNVTKKNIRLRASLKGQKNNITPEHLNELRLLVGNIPTKVWKERMQDDSNNNESPMFTDKAINVTEKVLKEFLISLEAAVNDNKVSQIQRAIKKAVEAFNKLNEDDQFVDTMEREELVEFMTQAVRLTGFKVEEGADITEEWRKW